MKTHRAVLALLALGGVIAGTASWAHPTMTRELLQKFWPDAQSATSKQIDLTPDTKKAIEKSLGGKLPKEIAQADTYVIVGKAGSLGVLVNFDPPGYDMGVAIDRDRKKITKVHVYKHSGAHTLDSPAFLKQFVGKTASSAFKVGKDVKAPKGAEKQGQGVATDLKAALLMVQKGF